jgi:hypothetical protein
VKTHLYTMNNEYIGNMPVIVGLFEETRKKKERKGK